MDAMDLRRTGPGQYTPITAIAGFGSRLRDRYDLALAMEMPAQGRVDGQQTVLEDESIILDVTDYAFGA